jgi:hypothetical protein
MSSKTLNLINRYRRVLKEQGELPPADEFNTVPQDATEAPDPNAAAAGEEVPMTSEGEDEYIANLIDAALFEPSPEDAKTLTDLQGIVKMKKYNNAREEILPILLNIIRPSTESNNIRQSLDKVQ